MPEGNYKSLNDKANAEKLKDFVKSGGRLIAIQGAVNLLAQNGDFGIKNKADKEDDKADSGYASLKNMAIVKGMICLIIFLVLFIKLKSIIHIHWLMDMLTPTIH